MIPGRNLKYQLSMTEKTNLPVLSDTERETLIDISGKLHNKHVTGEPCILIGNDRYSNWPVAQIRKSTKAR